MKEEEALRSWLGALLEGVAVALRGPPKPLTAHDWSQLPKEAAVLTDRAEVAELHATATASLLREKIEELDRWRAKFSSALKNEHPAGS